MNTNTINNRKVVIGLVIALALAVVIVALVAGFNSSSNKAAGSASIRKATTSSIKDEATTWVQTLVVKFKDMDKVPAKCANYVPGVDLTKVHLYVQESNKESPTAFGPEMGTNPCDVTIQLVERMYRDPALLLADAKRLKLVDFEQKNLVKEVNALKADADKRRELTNQVLGWYADTNHAFILEAYDGAYQSDVMSSTGATAAVSSNKKSMVMTIVDRRSGAIKAQRRLNCGWQDFKPNKPRKPEKPHAPCTPPSVMLPQGVCSEGKDANQAPVPTGGPVIHCKDGYLGRDGQCHNGTYTPPSGGGGSGGSGDGSDTGKGDSGPGATNTTAPPPTSSPAPAPPETSSPPTPVDPPTF